ncbi:MAG: single-stranded-DNA-specific exonuclease [Alteromonas naphthalenivorans]|jgi:single-stranded-DNA-specific exonuclease
MQTVSGIKYIWKLPETDTQKVLEIASQFSLSIPLSQILHSRGYITKDAIEDYLFSSEQKDVSSATLMKDAEKAVNRILKAIENKEKILVFGDYDVDGITSSALMMTALTPLGADVNFYLPHRVKDGYGLSTKVVKRAADNNYKVVITVDNGTTAFEQAKVAKERGIDLIITDHHQPHGELPDAYAIVNPHQKDCNYPFKEFAGVGVTFKILALLYEKLNKKLPEKAYELLLLGTVADVVPLLGENRFWVRYGLQWANTKDSLSLRVLKENGKCTRPKLSSLDVGFRIAPQINALGRLEDPRQGVAFLLGADEKEARHIGSVLYQLNEARKQIERTIFEDVETLIENGTIDLTKEKIILAGGKKWPPGVIGLVASRLVGKYGRPVLLFHLTDKGKAKGSCRTIEAFNMFEALVENSELLDQFGGHAMAAGLALDQDKLQDLKQSLEDRADRILTESDLQQKLLCDAAITLPDVGAKLVRDMEYLEPFGAKNAQPVFYLQNVSLVQKPQLLKLLHVKCMVFAEGVIKPVIFFNRPELFEIFNAQEQEPFDLAVQITENHWQGRSQVELMGMDVANTKENA